MMSRLDGLEACRRIRSLGRTTPIIIVSALARPGDVAAGLEAGADTYIDKPITPGEVIDRIRDLVASRS